MTRELHLYPPEEYYQKLWKGIFIYSYLTNIKTNKKITISVRSKYLPIVALPTLFSLILIIVGVQETILAPFIGIIILSIIFLYVYYLEFNLERRISNGYLFVMQNDISMLKDIILSIIQENLDDQSEFTISNPYEVKGILFQGENHIYRITLFSRENKKTLVHFSNYNDSYSDHLERFTSEIAEFNT